MVYAMNITNQLITIANDVKLENFIGVRTNDGSIVYSYPCICCIISDRAYQTRRVEQ